jgi:hypothetical protein
MHQREITPGSSPDRNFPRGREHRRLNVLGRYEGSRRGPSPTTGASGVGHYRYHSVMMHPFAPADILVGGSVLMARVKVSHKWNPPRERRGQAAQRIGAVPPIIIFRTGQARLAALLSRS